MQDAGQRGTPPHPALQGLSQQQWFLASSRRFVRNRPNQNRRDQANNGGDRLGGNPRGGEAGISLNDEQEAHDQAD